MLAGSIRGFLTNPLIKLCQHCNEIEPVGRGFKQAPLYCVYLLAFIELFCYQMPSLIITSAVLARRLTAANPLSLTLSCSLSLCMYACCHEHFLSLGKTLRKYTNPVMESRKAEHQRQSCFLCGLDRPLASPLREASMSCLKGSGHSPKDSEQERFVEGSACAGPLFGLHLLDRLCWC